MFLATLLALSASSLAQTPPEGSKGIEVVTTGEEGQATPPLPHQKVASITVSPHRHSSDEASSALEGEESSAKGEPVADEKAKARTIDSEEEADDDLERIVKAVNYDPKTDEDDERFTIPDISPKTIREVLKSKKLTVKMIDCVLYYKEIPSCPPVFARINRESVSFFYISEIIAPQREEVCEQF